MATWRNPFPIDSRFLVLLLPLLDLFIPIYLFPLIVIPFIFLPLLLLLVTLWPKIISCIAIISPPGPWITKCVCRQPPQVHIVVYSSIHAGRVLNLIPNDFNSKQTNYYGWRGIIEIWFGAVRPRPLPHPFPSVSSHPSSQRLYRVPLLPHSLVYGYITWIHDNRTLLICIKWRMALKHHRVNGVNCKCGEWMDFVRYTSQSSSSSPLLSNRYLFSDALMQKMIWSIDLQPLIRDFDWLFGWRAAAAAGWARGRINWLSICSQLPRAPFADWIATLCSAKGHKRSMLCM